MSLPNPESEKIEPVTATTIPPVAPPVTSAPSLSTSTPGNGKALMPFFIVAAVLILGVGGYFAWTYFNPAPEKVMRGMREAVLDVESVAYNVSVVSDASEENSVISELIPSDLTTFSSDVPGKISFEASGQISAPKVADETSGFSIKFSLKNLETKAEFLAGDWLSFNKKGYFKISSVDSSNEELNSVLTALGDSWLSLSETGWEEFDSTMDEAAVQIEENTPVISDENKAKLETLFVETDFFKVTKKLKNEKVNGEDCFHYLVDLDKEALVSYAATSKLYSGDTSSSGQAMEILTKTQTVSGEIWLSRKDYLPRHLVLNASFVPSEDGAVGTASLDLSLNEYNQPVKLEVPKKIMSYADFFSAMIDSLIEQLGDFSFGTVSEEDLDGDGLTNEEEIDFGSDPNLTDTDSDGMDDLSEWFADADPNNSDSDGDGVTDGTEYDAGTDPLDPESK